MYAQDPKKATETASGEVSTTDATEQTETITASATPSSENSEEKQVRPRRRRTTQKKPEESVQVTEKLIP